MHEPEPMTGGHRSGSLHKPKLAAAGWWWADSCIRGYVRLPEGFVHQQKNEKLKYIASRGFS